MKNIVIKMSLPIMVCLIIIMNGAIAQTTLEQVGPPAERNKNAQLLSFNMLGASLAANDFVSLKKLRKDGASTQLNYQIDFSKFKKIKPNDVSFKMTLMRDGVKLQKKIWRHVEKRNYLDLGELLSEAQVNDSLLIEVSGLPLKSTDKIRTIVFKK